MVASNAAGQVDITILVKALNEEEKIEACLRSAMAALERMDGVTGEVLLADSVSTDRTVDIAAGLGVRIVQFSNAADRSCGATLQLGYQYASGRFIYVLDGDMQLVPEFLPVAYAYLQSHPQVAGVGGKLIDTHVRTAADQHRIDYYSKLGAEQEVPSLGGGGLYRRTAIEKVEYLANRWLSAFEEAELGVRLRVAGYRLIRLSSPAVLHSGHTENSRQMLQRLWRSKRIEASGKFLRSALGRPWFKATVKTCWYVFAAPAVYGLAGLLILAGILLGWAWPALVAMPVLVWLGITALLAWRKRNVQYAVFSVMLWHVYTAGALRGFLAAPADPMLPIEARELSSAVRA